MVRVLKVRIKERWYTVEVEDLEVNPVRVLVDGDLVEVNLEDLLPATPTQLERAPSTIDTGESEAVKPPALAQHIVRAPMPGVIMSLSVSEGAQVAAGDEVCILEAMKMQQSLKTDVGGRIIRVNVQQGQQVQRGDSIVELG